MPALRDTREPRHAEVAEWLQFHMIKVVARAVPRARFGCPVSVAIRGGRDDTRYRGNQLRVGAE
jgi:hypothetical protein